MTRLAQRILMAFVFALPFAAQAAGGDEPKTAREWPADPVISKMQSLGKGNDWPAAVSLMKDAVTKNPQNADYHNLYAYSMRKGAGADMNLVFKHYGEALRIDPRHRGAHEYIGEAYLMVGNVGKAKEHLGQLDKICFFGCSEFTELKSAISDFETKKVAR